ncbi:hypothetical protein TDB9533_04083 [Thalassocella blandensis]|nr:hypothetical protein TDB9533_04083 [Thalassocella blandensis]
MSARASTTKASSTSPYAISFGSGFTVLELLSTLAIASIIASFAIPSLNSFAAANQKSQTTTQIISLLNEARKNAVNRSTKVVICPLDDSASCSEDWTRPISVFADDNGNQAIDYNEDLIKSIETHELTSRVTWLAHNNAAYIQFDDSGAAGEQSGHLLLCAENAENNQAIFVSAAGRTRIANNDEIPESCL